MQPNPLHAIWKRIQPYRTGIIAIAFWLVLILAVRQFMQANNLTFNDFVNQLSLLLRGTWWGPVLYVLVYLIRPVILFPASLLTLLGGNVFGLWPGFIYVLLAGTASSIIPYGVGRWFSSDQPTENKNHSAIQRFVSTLRRNPFQAILIMRLIYLPYDAVSLLAGSLRVPLAIFLLATSIGNLAGTLSFVGLGASVEGDITSGSLVVNPVVITFSIVILIASVTISRLLNRYQQRQSLVASMDSHHD